MSGSRDPRLVIARRDLASLSREKTIVLAILIQLFVAAFSSFLVVGLTSLYHPGSVNAQGVQIGVTGDASDELVAAVRSQDGATPVPLADREAASAAFADGHVDAVLVGSYVPATEGAGRVLQVTATVPEGNIRTTFVVVQVRGVLQSLERTERERRSAHLAREPLSLPREANASPYFGFTYTVLLPLLLFLPPFISGSVAVDSVTEEIERETLELLRVAPVSSLDVMEGKALAMVALAPAQAALWLGLLSLNGITVANPLAMLALVTAVAAIVVVFGVVLGLRFGQRRSAQLSYSVLTLAVFGAAVLLPEHPATTAAKLAIDSATGLTFAHVAGYVVVAALLYALTRRYVDRLSLDAV
ncbi:MAG: ABC transporter permease [Haloarculaceae archaeon]